MRTKGDTARGNKRGINSDYIQNTTTNELTNLSCGSGKTEFLVQKSTRPRRLRAGENQNTSNRHLLQHHQSSSRPTGGTAKVRQKRREERIPPPNKRGTPRPTPETHELVAKLRRAVGGNMRTKGHSKGKITEPKTNCNSPIKRI